MCASLIINSSFPNLFQITKLQKDFIASAGVAIEKLVNNPDVETSGVDMWSKAELWRGSEFHTPDSYLNMLLFWHTVVRTQVWLHKYIFSYLYFFRLVSWQKASWSCGTSQFHHEQSSRGNFGCPVCPKTSRNITGALVLIRCHHSSWGRCTMLPAWGMYYLFYVLNVCWF